MLKKHWLDEKRYEYLVLNEYENVNNYYTLNSTPSCHKYSYFGPPDITGQDSSVQTSATVPYNNCTRLKKSTT